MHVLGGWVEETGWGLLLFLKCFSKMGTISQMEKKNGIMPNIETDVLDQEAAGN